MENVKISLDDYLMRAVDCNIIRVYYPFIGKNGRKGYRPVGDFTIDLNEQLSNKERLEEITRKSEEIIIKYLAQLN